MSEITLSEHDKNVVIPAMMKTYRERRAYQNAKSGSEEESKHGKTFREFFNRWADEEGKVVS